MGACSRRAARPLLLQKRSTRMHVMWGTRLWALGAKAGGGSAPLSCVRVSLPSSTLTSTRFYLLVHDVVRSARRHLKTRGLTVKR